MSNLWKGRQPSSPRPGLLLALVVLLALAVRENFALTSIVEVPIRGDIRDYVNYAWNLIHHDIFSLAPPDPATPMPDSYRSPGFPWLIAACMAVLPNSGWYFLALQAQILLGTATVALVGLLGRIWLPGWAALLAAALLALWPHHIAASGALLSEVLFGFTLVAALYLFEQKKWMAAGAMFAFSFLVNPLIALFPPVLAATGWRRFGRRNLTIFMIAFLIPVAAWSARNALMDHNATARTGRLAANLVQGSWPLYHAAYRASFAGIPEAKALLAHMGEEEQLLAENPAEGLREIGHRFARAPMAYLAWYGIQKPWNLWGWNIQMGWGGPYFLEVERSSLERVPVLRAIKQGFEFVNPALTLLMALGIMMTVYSACRQRRTDVGLDICLLALYLTALHAVLQAEPRYANAYRGIEALLVSAALVGLVSAIARRTWRARARNAAGGRTSDGHPSQI